jgi:hypothetical protein
MAQVAIEAGGLGARQKMELEAVNQTLQVQAKAVASAASEGVQGVAREAGQPQSMSIWFNSF